MNESDGPLKHSPFTALEKFLRDKPLSPPESPQKPTKGSENAGAPAIDEERVFKEAMEGVKRMPRGKRKTMKKNWARPSNYPVRESKAEVRQHLENLIKYGQGFIISQTPEYLEGTGRDIPLEFAERLHRGDFAIQAHLDLHGLSVVQAKEAFDTFLHEVIRSRKQGVLIIHGRGISSAGEPVLKNKVKEWLTRSHWRKWVIAFTSAQSYDGGAGATYILLRHRILSVRSRKT